MKLRFTSEAKNDLMRIGDYIAEQNPRRAISFVQELRVKSKELTELALAFPLVPQFEHFGIRRRVFGSYLIFYRADAEAVTILHVGHGAQDHAIWLRGWPSIWISQGNDDLSADPRRGQTIIHTVPEPNRRRTTTMTDTLQQIVLASRPKGKPTLENFRLEDAPMPALPPGGLLLRVKILSLDPYMRGRMDDRKSYAKPVALGEPMGAEGVAEVMESDHPGYKIGDIVLAPTGWRTHCASDGIGVAGVPLRKLDPSLAPVSTALGVLGMPGFTAYGGLNVIGKPKAGETVVVAAASGPVGSLVGQLAKLAGCRAVGIAGGTDKCAYLKQELGFNAALDHRAPGLPEALAAACPDGIDVYFENVGGAIWQAVFPLLNPFARVPVCGLISQYSGAPDEAPGRLAATMRDILTKSLTIRGFINYEFAAEHYSAFLQTVSQGITADRIRYREDVTDGLSNAPAAFLGLLEGRNFGKALVRVSA